MDLSEMYHLAQGDPDLRRRLLDGAYLVDTQGPDVTKFPFAPPELEDDLIRMLDLDDEEPSTTPQTPEREADMERFNRTMRGLRVLEGMLGFALDDPAAREINWEGLTEEHEPDVLDTARRMVAYFSEERISE